MQLPRRQYLALAGVETSLFKTLQRREQVPLFATSENYGGKPKRDVIDLYDEVDASGYSVGEAMMLAIAHNFVTENSFTRDSAKRFVQGRPELTGEAINRIEAGEEIWIAGFSPDYGEGGTQRVATDKDGKIVGLAYSFGQVGTLVEVMEKITKFTEKRGKNIKAISLLNVTPIVKNAKKAAEAYGLKDIFKAYE